MEKRIPRQPKIYLISILLFIFGDVASESYLFRTFSYQPKAIEFIFFIGLLLLQTIAAPLQSAFSDLYCRKKSLVVALSSSLLSLVLLFFYSSKLLYFLPILILASLLKGASGNSIPLSWAAIADTQERNYRFSFGLSTVSYAIAYLILIIADLKLKDSYSIIILIFFYILILYICISRFKDIRDKEMSTRQNTSRTNILKLARTEINILIKELRTSHIQYALIAFFLWEVSLYCVLLLYVDFDEKEFILISITMMFGYLGGVMLLRILRTLSDQKMSRIGFIFGAVSLIPFYVHLFFHKAPNLELLAICYFFHAVGLGILPPTIFAMLAKGSHPHEQGRIYGLIESADTLSFLFASICVMIYNIANLQLIYIISLSFITVLLSWWPFMKYEKIRPKTPG